MCDECEFGVIDLLKTQTKRDIKGISKQPIVE